MSIIIVLAGLILATSGYVQKKGARSRAEAEIAAMSAALESYKADNGIYPTKPETDALKRKLSDQAFQITKMRANTSTLNSQAIQMETPTTANDGKNYMGGTLKPNMLSPNPPAAGTSIRDPFGNCYGYSTVKSYRSCWS